MSGKRGGVIFSAWTLAAVAVLPSCGLIKLPFRVAGAVVDTTYEGGKKVVDKSSDALEKRRKRKEKEEEEKAKAEAAGQLQKKQEAPAIVPPAGTVPEVEPIIPLGPTAPPQ